MTQAFVDIDRELAELRAKAIELDRVRILLAAAKKEANTLRRRPHFPERGIAITFHETRVIAETLKTLQDRGHLRDRIYSMLDAAERAEWARILATEFPNA